MISMAKRQKGATEQRMSVSNQKWMTVNKTTNTRKGASVRVTTGRGGEQLIKGNTKIKMDDFQCWPPSYLFFKAPISGQTALFVVAQ